MSQISGRLKVALPLAFKTRRPTHENQVNDQIEAILSSDKEDLEREFPVLRFGTAKTIPDHSKRGADLFIEAKYLRTGQASSKVSDELAADSVKYGRDRKILFVLYDPDRAIADDAKFAAPFEANGKCCVCFVR